MQVKEIFTIFLLLFRLVGDGRQGIPPLAFCESPDGTAPLHSPTACGCESRPPLPQPNQTSIRL